MRDQLLSLARSRADKTVEDIGNGVLSGRAFYSALASFRSDVCQDAFIYISDGSADCCRGFEIVNILKAQYGGCQSGLLWKDKKRYIWRLENVHFVFFRKKNDRVFSCLRNGVRRKRARSGVFEFEHYPLGCSPEAIIDVLISYDSIIGFIDKEYDRVLKNYRSVKKKLKLIRQILATAEIAREFEPFIPEVLPVSSYT